MPNLFISWLFVVALVLTAVPSIADETVTIQDGRKVLLRDDGTYELLGNVQNEETRSYRAISFDDLLLDITQLGGQAVRTVGWLHNDGRFEHFETFYRDRLLGGGRLNLDLTRISRDDKKAVLTRCRVICQVEIRGVATGPPLASLKIRVHSLVVLGSL